MGGKASGVRVKNTRMTRGAGGVEEKKEDKKRDKKGKKRKKKEEKKELRTR